jgi:outer membrane protein assembly factor BamB
MTLPFEPRCASRARTAQASQSRCAGAFRFFAALGVLLAFVLSASGEHTRRWRQSSYDEFVRGTAHGIAVRSDGHLELAPKFTLLADADASYLWSLRTAPDGVLYAAGGSPARVFRFATSASGKPTVVFDSADLAAQAIAFDAQGTLYVATSPDGKVYKVPARGEKTVFFDPKTKYIWDLVFGADGTLYVATGDKGQIFAVTPDGHGALFYSSEEAHVRVLTVDGKGSLIAGTEPSGRILRITKRNDRADERNRKQQDVVTARGSAEGFVLYESAKREITSLATAPDGTIYAGAIGEKQHAVAPAATTVISTPQGTTTFTSGATISTGNAQAIFTPFPPALTSSIYRISPDGAPEELWSSRDEIVYSLGLASDGRLLAGTGNNGALLAIDRRGVYAQLAKSGSAQITGMARNAQGKIFLCTANPGKVFSVGPEYEPEGTYESRSFDAQLFSQWGRLEWWSPSPAGETATSTARNGKSGNADPRLEFFVRSGNTEEPNTEWSRWFGPYIQSGAAIEAPAARYVQWKAVIHGARPGDGLEWASVAYLPRNVAPLIDGIALQDPGVRAQPAFVISPGQTQNVTLRQPPADNSNGVVITQSGASPHFEQPPQAFQQKGYATVLWNAHDPNEDELRYAVYIRGENEREWKLLKDKLDQKFYSWDTTGMPDGAYYLKIVASDSPANPPGVALTADRESERFEIDNTPPVIEKLETVATSSHAGNASALATVTVKFIARDAATSVERAQYSVDSGDWILCAPTGRISDAPEEDYEFSVTDLRPGEHTIAVRAYDRFENVGSGKTIVTIPPAKP